MPWTHMANATPQIRGTLSIEGKPLGNVPLRLATGVEGNPCAGKSTETSTNTDGTFAVASIQEFRFLMVMMAHSFFPWSLCSKREGNWTALVVGKEYALVDSGPVGVQVVKCDLANSPDLQCQLTWEKE